MAIFNSYVRLPKVSHENLPGAPCPSQTDEAIDEAIPSSRAAALRSTEGKPGEGTQRVASGQDHLVMTSTVSEVERSTMLLRTVNHRTFYGSSIPWRTVSHNQI